MSDLKLTPNTTFAGATIRLSQDSDDLSDEKMGHLLEIEVADAGAGPYIVISTKRWALDPEELQKFADLLNQCVEQFGEKTHD